MVRRHWAALAISIWALASMVAGLRGAEALTVATVMTLLCGSVFWLCGLWVARRPVSGLMKTLTVVLFGGALVYFPGPGVASEVLAILFSLVRSAAVLWGFVALLTFVRHLSNPGKGPEDPVTAGWTVVPAAILWLLLSFRAVLKAIDGPDLSTGIYVVTGLILVGYFLAGIIIFLRAYIRMPVDARSAQGFRLMLWGSVAGFLPAALANLPMFANSDAHYYLMFSMALLPAVWFHVARKSELCGAQQADRRLVNDASGSQ